MRTRVAISALGLPYLPFELPTEPVLTKPFMEPTLRLAFEG
jgi:hypothetical protein